MRSNMDFETKLAVIEAGQACENVHAWHAILHASGHTSEEIATFWAKYRDDIYWGYNMAGMYGRDEVMANWAGGLEGNAYNLVSFQNEAYTDSAALTIDPAPDTLIRVFMAWKPLSTAVTIEEQELKPVERNGFTVVEWGGTEVR